MKKQVKNFGQYINESEMNQTTTSIDFGYGKLGEMAEGFAALAELAPNCQVMSTDGVKRDYMTIEIVGPAEECDAVADYWNELRMSKDIYTAPYGMKSTSDLASELLNRRQDDARPRFTI
jgi:hypothetical protein